MAAGELVRSDEQPRHLSVVPPPPPPLLPSPQLPVPEQLRGILRHYRRSGTSFDAAWDQALELVTWPSSRRDASEWRHAVEETREGWRASYEGWPQESREAAVSALSRLLAAEQHVA